MKNDEIAGLFERMGHLLEIKGENVFKVRAYEKAAENIRTCGEDIEILRQDNRLGEIAGLGKALKEKIGEYLDTGQVQAYQQLLKEIPQSVLEMVDVPSVGPKKAKLFFERLNLRSLDDLDRAVRAGALTGLPGIQSRTVENIRKGIETVRAGQQRMNLGQAAETAGRIMAILKECRQARQVAVAGSLRRMKEEVGDIDILAVSDKPDAVMDAFVRGPQVKQVLAYGPTKLSVLTSENVQADLRVVDGDSFGAALLYFTGSKGFNVKLRQLAVRKKMRINEYGIFAVGGKKEKRLAGKTERECFAVLGFPEIPPELREDIGEKRLFTGHRPKVPALVERGDIRGDGHVHSRWSDGKDSIGDLARAAAEKGYAYIGISDHSASLRVAGGLTEAALKKKKAEIAAVNRRQKKVRVLYGTEVEIDKQGHLDYNERILKEFDLVIAAIHSVFDQGREQLTRRLEAACRHPYVDVIAHPFCRHFGKREPLDIDFDRICRLAAETGTILEINAFPVRLDLDSVRIFHAQPHGVRFMINTDAHRVDQLDFMEYGVGLARRGWLTKQDVVNTYPLKKFLSSLKRHVK